MRYTTIIDVSTVADFYRNKNAVLLYLHFVLKSDYTDARRDWYKASIRQLSFETGMSLSATRHSIALLQKYGLLSQQKEGWWKVLKFVEEKVITSRRTKKKQSEDVQRGIERIEENERQQRQLEEQAKAAVSYEEYLKNKEQE